VAMIYGLVLPRLMLEYFGSEVNGLTQSVSQFLGIIGFLDMGVGQVVRSSLYKPLEENDIDQISRIMVSGGRFYRKIAYSLLCYVVILVVSYPFLVNRSFDWLYISCLIVIMSIGSFAQYYFGIIQEQLIHAHQKSYFVYYIQILFYLFNLIVCVCMINMNCSIHAIKLATAMIFLLKPLFYTWYVRRNYNIDWKISYEEEPIKQKWYGVAQHVSAVVLESTDNIVLTLFSTLSNVSVYSVYYMVVTNIHGLYQVAVTGIQSAAGAVWAKQDDNGIKQLFYSVEMSLHAVTVFLFSCTGLLIVPFVQVYTNEISDANYIQPIFAAILVLAYGIRCLRTPYNIWIMAAGHFKQTQRCHIIAAILNLAFSIFAVFQWGLVGVAIGTFVAMCYQTTWMIVYTTKNLIKCKASHILKRLLVDVVAALMICLTASKVALHNVSYLGWIVMATKVAGIAFLIVVAVTLIFYYPQVKRLFHKVKR